jgi:diguanylate cyclase (GGDEF)-like protein
MQFVEKLARDAMNYYIVIGLLNTSMSAIFGAALFAIWRQNRHYPYIAVFSISYAVRSICFGIFYFAFALENPVIRFLANIFLMLAMLLLSVGLSRRRNQRPRYVSLGIIAALSLGFLFYKQFIDANLLARVIVLNFGLATVGFLMVSDVARSGKRTPVEQVLFGLTLVSCVGFLLRPLFLIASGPDGQRFEGSYWLVVSISDALICAMTAVGIFAVIASDVMDGIRSDAEIDALSGLLNRRGFESRAFDALARPKNGTPAAIILCDLDHFKSINDRFGHGCGDQIIKGFSKVLKQQSSSDAIIARLGGEEFVILLPPGKGFTAQRMAEEARAVFKEIAPGIVSGAASPTASFGIAHAREHDNLETLMERADRALYQAKGDGRDCVRMME